MRHVLALFLVVVGFGGYIASQGLATASAAGSQASLITIDGTIDSVSAGYLSRGVDAANDNESQFIVVVLDTPGGLFSSTRDMVEDILASDIPVIVYVSPPGARAASSGTFITAAAHVAAMAPTTNIGAASPVGAGGRDLPETLKSKATQDAAAFMRGIAEERGRNADALEQAVLEAASFSASEALQQNIVDLIAKDMDDLLAKLDGRVVKIKDREAVLETEGVAVKEIKRTPVERFLGILADPNIAFLLLTIGGIGLVVEVLSPGLLGPGIIGVIALALAFVALGNLPVNWVGVGLIALAMALFVLEIQAPGIGIFGVGGGISFVLGAFLLFGGFSPPAIPTLSFRVSYWMIGAVSAILFGFMIILFRTVLQGRGAVYTSPSKDVVGQVGVTRTPLDPQGTVKVAGETWSAVSVSGETIGEGQRVVVGEIEGLTLKVYEATNGSN